MVRYALDANIYIDALRVRAAADDLARFASSQSSALYLSVVVAMELRIGARHPRQVAAFEEGIVQPFERRKRLIVPSATAFLEAGRVVALLSGGRQVSRRHPLVNDALLAASCRENGITLITRDVDFSRVARVLPGFRHVAPWPRRTPSKHSS